MICPKCGREVINGSVICPGCGNNLNQEIQQNFYSQNNNINQQNINNNQNNNKANKKFNLIPIVGVCIVLVAVIGFIFFNKKDNKDKNDEKVDEIMFDVENELSDNEVKKLTTCPYDIFNYQNDYDFDDAFLMPIEGVFVASGKPIVTGKIRRGVINVGDNVQIIGVGNNIINSVIDEIEQNRNKISRAKMGDEIALTLRGVSYDQLERGKVVINPNSMTTKKTFEADIKLLTKEQGGLDEVFFESQRVSYYFYSTDFRGNIYFAEGLNKINPGDCAKVAIELDYDAAMEIGTTFSIRTGGRTIGAGVVTETDISKIKYSKDVVDRFVNVRNDSNREFLMYVEDVFEESGPAGGVVATGRVEKGKLYIGDQVKIIGSKGTKDSSVISIEMFRKNVDYVKAEDSVGIMLSNINRDDIQRGDKIILR